MKQMHTFLNEKDSSYPLGKIVCIGKNYRSSFEEPLGLIEDPPVLFMKPTSALVPIEDPVQLPGYSPCYYEVELAVLIGSKLQNADLDQVKGGIAGYGIALDLTLKELLDELKEQRRPWELAKSFARSCPISPFIQTKEIADPLDTLIRLTINDEVRQEATSGLMIRSVFDLVSCISKYFVLQPGDIVLTGTPVGGGKLQSGDKLVVELDNTYRYTTSVA